MAFLDGAGVTTLTNEIKAYADAAYAAISHSHDGFAYITEQTTADWSANLTYVPLAGELCIWTDYAVVEEQNIPAIKIGDGTTYAVDLPFLCDDIRAELEEHVNNTTVHITSTERNTWNDKLNAAISGEVLVLST